MLDRARYEKGLQKVKVEISKRQYADGYTIQDYLGVTMRTLDLLTMFAHKLCAISDRRAMVNRDLFDTWWLLTRMDVQRQLKLPSDDN